MKNEGAVLAAFVLLSTTPLIAQGSDMLTLEPSFETKATYTSSCILSYNTPGLCIRLTDKSATDFASWTKRHVGGTMNVKIDDRVIVSPTLRGALTGGVLPIPFDTQADASAALTGLQNHKMVLTVDVTNK